MQKWGLTIFLALTLCGISYARKGFYFTKDEIAHVYIQTKYCEELKDGSIECSHVRVVLSSLSLDEEKVNGKR